MPLHPIVEELMKQYNISPHMVVPNTWHVHAVVLALNAYLGIELGIDELLSVYCLIPSQVGSLDLFAQDGRGPSAIRRTCQTNC